MSCKAAALVFLMAMFVCFAAESGEHTRIVILGTGTPVADPVRAGPGVAIVHRGEAYVFDAGDGVVRRAIQAHVNLGIGELDPVRIRHLFFTHLHSDHIADYSALTSTLWWRRKQKLHAWGPKGLADLTEAMNNMLKVEADLRKRGTPPEVIGDPTNYRAEASEIEEGIVFRKDDLTIEAFTVPHGAIEPAFGYKITTADKSIVISGDTSYSEKLIEKAKGVDVLIHEVASAQGLKSVSKYWQQYHNASHTRTDQVAEAARKAKPGLLVLYHILFFSTSAEDLLNEVRAAYDGPVVLASDLQMF